MYFYYEKKFLNDALEQPPKGAIPISDDEHLVLMKALSSGMLLEEDAGGRPITVPPPPPTLKEARAAKLAEIIAACDAALLPLAASYSAMERSTWDQQVSEAQTLQADADAAAPLLRGIATGRGIDLMELAVRVLRNKAGLEIISGAVLGQKQALEDKLDDAADVAAVLAIRVAYALPGAQ